MTCLKYLWYVLRHKWFVFVECCRLGIPWWGVIHDLSKFRPDEFVPYARHFYPSGKDRPIPAKGYIKSEDRGDPAFDAAWKRHWERNPHHWQFWLAFGPNAMPDVYRREMLADWRGAGKAQGRKCPDECKNWYLAHREQMTLHPETRAWIESELGVAKGA